MEFVYIFFVPSPWHELAKFVSKYVAWRGVEKGIEIVGKKSANVTTYLLYIRT